MESIIEFSHNVLLRNLSRDDVVLDMTVGNGKDTLFLVKHFKFVYGFDIQEVACTKANELLKGYSNYKIINDSHLYFDRYVKEEFAGAIFNLGYLPGGSKEIHTEVDVVLETVKKVLKKIIKGGVCVLVFYPGFPSGLEEAKVIESYLRNINQKEFTVLKYEFINQINNPPYVVAIKVRI